MSSNDPANPTIDLSITAFVEVEFDYESNLIDVGTLHKGDTASGQAYLSIKHPEKTKVADISSSSPFVSAKLVGGDAGKMKIEVTVLPGMKPGKINETVTVHSDANPSQTARLKITGNIIGDVKVTPEMVRFELSASKGVSDQDAQEIQIVNKSAKKKLRVLGVADPTDRLQVSLSTVEDGVSYVVTAKPKSKVLQRTGSVVGSLIITTDNADQNRIEVRYNIMVRK